MALHETLKTWLAILALGGAMMLGSQQSAAAGPDSRPVVNIHCTLTGSAKSAAGLTRAAVCARFARTIETALKVRLVETATAPGPKGRWIAIQVKLGVPAHAEAAFSSRLGRSVRNHQSLGIDVMDKPLDLREIDMLARQVAEVLRKAG